MCSQEHTGISSYPWRVTQASPCALSVALIAGYRSGGLWFPLRPPGVWCSCGGDGAGSSRLPAHWLLWIHSLTWQSVSTWPTSRAEELLCEPYLMYTFGILQPGTVHFLHIVRTSPTKKWFSSYRCRIAPNLLKRPNCCWFVLWKCLNSLGGCQWP